VADQISGSCLCGACSYTTMAAPLNIRACHCRNCQKATGAAFYARVMVPLDEVAIDGPVGWYESTPGVRRGFCLQCGTTLFSERANANVVGLSFGSLDEPDRFFPTEHIWTSRKQAWLELADDLPHHLEGPV
jgi:hypothetical protein